MEAAAAAAAAVAADAQRRSGKFSLPRMSFCPVYMTLITLVKGEVRRVIRTRGACVLPHRLSVLVSVEDAGERVYLV
jgi:hypothetical protein